MAGNPGKNALFGAVPETRGLRRLDGGVRSQMRTGLCIENPCFATRTAKSSRGFAVPTDEKRRWQSGFEQPPHCIQAQITGNLRARIREFEDAQQAVPKRGHECNPRCIPLAENVMRVAYSADG
jgi:hypothetical protein